VTGGTNPLLNIYQKSTIPPLVEGRIYNYSLVTGSLLKSHGLHRFINFYAPETPRIWLLDFGLTGHLMYKNILENLIPLVNLKGVTYAYL